LGEGECLDQDFQDLRIYMIKKKIANASSIMFIL